MPKCYNDPKKRFSGRELTPLGKGYTSSNEKIGKRMKGIDGSMYVVKKSGKNKKWVKIDTKQNVTSPMSRRRKKKKPKVEEEYYSSSSDEEDIDDDTEWKLEAAEERCNLSDVICSETLLMNVAFLAWSYFKDWYRRVRHGEDPFSAYEDIMIK